MSLQNEKILINPFRMKLDSIRCPLNAFRVSLFSFLSLLPILYYLTNLYRMTDHSAVPFIVMTVVAGSVGFFLFFFGKGIKKGVLLFFYIIYIATLFLNIVIIENVKFLDIITDTLLFGITVVMFAFPHSYSQGVLFFGLSLLPFLFSSFTGSETHYVLTSSGNYISVLMILSMSIFYIGLNNEKRELKWFDIIPAFICFLLAVWAKGRGGILSCGFLLVMMLLVYMQGVLQKKMRRWLLFWVMLFLACMIILISDITIIDNITNLGKWGSRGMDNTPRLELWSGYFTKMNESFVYALMGVPLFEVASIHAIGDNPHNSFIYLHATNGLLTSIFFMFLLVSSCIYQFHKKQFVLLVLTMTIVLRGMTDKFIFGQYGMPIFLYLVLYPFVHKMFQRNKTDDKVLR